MSLLSSKDKIFLAGHNGLVGSTFKRYIKNEIAKGKVQWSLFTEERKNLDLKCQQQVENFIDLISPDIVIIAAAKVGGINANKQNNSEFLIENLQIQNNLIFSSLKNKVKRLLFLGSSCIYPKNANQPLSEDCLLSSNLEPTNEGYALAKICGLKLCQFLRIEQGFDAISVMPPNLYGPNDNFNINNGHVIPSLIRKFHEAKISNKSHVRCWGSGIPKREFMYVDDLVECCMFLLRSWDPKEISSSKGDLSYINVGTGKDITILELANQIKKIVGYEGEILWDTSMPDGSPKKLLNIERLKKLGWEHSTSLKDGLERTYKSFIQKYNSNLLRDL